MCPNPPNRLPDPAPPYATSSSPDPVSDPQLAGLPPYVNLPDARNYRLRQFRARVGVNLAAVAVLVAFGLTFDTHPMITWTCTALLAVVLVVNLIRYGRARKQ